MSRAIILNETNFTGANGKDVTICLMRKYVNDYFYELTYYNSDKDKHVEVDDESEHADYLEEAIIDVCFDYPEAISDLMSQFNENQIK